jgi:hypothetical protein
MSDKLVMRKGSQLSNFCTWSRALNINAQAKFWKNNDYTQIQSLLLPDDHPTIAKLRKLHGLLQQEDMDPTLRWKMEEKQSEHQLELQQRRAEIFAWTISCVSNYSINKLETSHATELNTLRATHDTPALMELLQRTHLLHFQQSPSQNRNILMRELLDLTQGKGEDPQTFVNRFEDKVNLYGSQLSPEKFTTYLNDEDAIQNVIQSFGPQFTEWKALVEQAPPLEPDVFSAILE